MASTRSKLDEIVESFSTLEDPRSEINRRHPLPSVLVIAVLAVLAGAAGPTAIARWAKYKEDLLTGILDLPRGQLPVAIDIGKYLLHWAVVAWGAALPVI